MLHGHLLLPSGRILRALRRFKAPCGSNHVNYTTPLVDRLTIESLSRINGHLRHWGAEVRKVKPKLRSTHFMMAIFRFPGCCNKRCKPSPLFTTQSWFRKPTTLSVEISRGPLDCVSIWAITSLRLSWKSHSILLQRYTCRRDLHDRIQRRSNSPRSINLSSFMSSLHVLFRCLIGTLPK